MAPRTVSKGRTSNARSGPPVAPPGKERRAQAAERDRERQRRAPVELALPEGGRGKAPRRGRQEVDHPLRLHHQGGGALANPAGTPKRRAIERHGAARPPQRRRQRRASANR